MASSSENTQTRSAEPLVLLGTLSHAFLLFGGYLPVMFLSSFHITVYGEFEAMQPRLTQLCISLHGALILHPIASIASAAIFLALEVWCLRVLASTGKHSQAWWLWIAFTVSLVAVLALYFLGVILPILAMSPSISGT